jgi:hypothetical protein
MCEPAYYCGDIPDPCHQIFNPCNLGSINLILHSTPQKEVYRCNIRRSGRPSKRAVIARTPDIVSLDFFLCCYVKDKVCAAMVTEVEDLKARIRDVITKSAEASWLAHGRKWNFDCNFALRHSVSTRKCAECIKKILYMYPSNDISFTFFMATYYF